MAGPTAEKQATAIHEAGHAVASIYERRTFVSVSIIEREGSLGRLLGKPAGEWFRPDRFVDGRARKLIEQEIRILLAGPAAESRHLNWSDAGAAGAQRDYEMVADLASYVCGSDAEVEAYIEWLQQRTLNMIRARPWWHSIEQLADELVAAVGELSYNRARRIVTEARRDDLRRWGEQSGVIRPA